MSTNVRVRVTPGHITVGEAAILKRCSAKRIRDEIARGTLPAVRRFGDHGHWLIPLAAIEARAARGLIPGSAGGQETHDADRH